MEHGQQPAAPGILATRFTCESVLEEVRSVSLLEIPTEGQPRAVVRIENAAAGFFRDGAVYAVLITDVERAHHLAIVPIDRCPASGGVHDFYPLHVETTPPTPLTNAGAHHPLKAATVVCRWCGTSRKITTETTGGAAAA